MRNICGKMKKTLILIALITLLILFPSPAKAGIISVSPDGRIMVKVLSAQTSSELLGEETSDSEVEVKKVRGLTMPDPSISLEKVDGKVSLAVLSEGSYQELDVTGISEDLVEVEARPEVKRLTVSAVDGGFVLKQGGFNALTEYPVEVDAKNAKLSLVTDRGKEFLSVFPLEAIESALRSGIITKIDNDIVIKDTEDSLNYQLTGEKVFNILGLTDYHLPVSVSISTSNGYVVSVDSSSPVYRILKVLFI